MNKILKEKYRCYHMVISFGGKINQEKGEEC